MATTSLVPGEAAEQLPIGDLIVERSFKPQTQSETGASANHTSSRLVADKSKS